MWSLPCTGRPCASIQNEAWPVLAKAGGCAHGLLDEAESEREEGLLVERLAAVVIPHRESHVVEHRLPPSRGSRSLSACEKHSHAGTMTLADQARPGSRASRWFLRPSCLLLLVNFGPNRPAPRLSAERWVSATAGCLSAGHQSPRICRSGRWRIQAVIATVVVRSLRSASRSLGVFGVGR